MLGDLILKLYKAIKSLVTRKMLLEMAGLGILIAENVLTRMNGEIWLVRQFLMPSFTNQMLVKNTLVILINKAYLYV